MEHPRKHRRGIVPYNPGLQDLVEDKREWTVVQTSTEADHAARGWHQRGYLPHRDQIGLTQFVTFRLVDSLPEHLRGQWEHLLKLADKAEARRRLEICLDRGAGACHLRLREIAERVQNALLIFEGQRYALRAWVIMPNHVHVVFQQQESLGKIIKSWKSYTARECNKLLGRGGAFWAEDYWDTYMRDREQELRTTHYVEQNPVKARFVRTAQAYPWSSARLRDDFGRLVLP